MRVVVAGALANKPGYGGEAWVRLSWARGLRAMGAEVLFLEEIDGKSCVGTDGSPCEFEESRNLAYFREVTAAWGLEGSAALIHYPGGAIDGPDLPEVLDFAAAADLLVNISGHLAFEPVLRRVPWKAYVDLDPGFTQFWHAAGERGLRLRGHDLYFTVGENIGTPGCPIPTGGIRWLPLRQPVSLEDWPPAEGGAAGRFTTVASWRGAYGPVEFGGRRYGLKVHEFRKYVGLPRLLPRCHLEIALDIHPADAPDRRLLLERGWHLEDPRKRAGDPASFRAYVQGSGAEFSVAQGIYAETACGWFSDRSVRYLASGRPVLVQDTGFGRSLPVGEGLLAFRGVEEAAAGARRILGEYDHHRRAARQIAEEFFDARSVLADFLERVDFHRSRVARQTPGRRLEAHRNGGPAVGRPETERDGVSSPRPGAVGPRAAARARPRPGAGRTILVSGMVAGVPGQGGAAWAVLQYVLGLRRLGHEVCLVEPVARPALRPPGAELETSANAAYFRAVAARFGLEGRAALLLAGTERTVGLPYEELRRTSARADLLVNLSGLLADEALLEPIPVRLYLDLDPGFTQLWHAAEGIDMGFDRHTHFATVGLGIGSAACHVPTCGVSWTPTRQPVVLEEWPAGGEIRRDALTTVGNWRGYGSIEHGGVFYGQKAHALRPLMDLPARTEERFELALAIDPGETKDLRALRANGWRLVDPAGAAGTPDRYREFVRGSKAEFGVAKSGYVAAACGWFGDRSICYLASGRPVLAQETGFSRHLPAGDGILPFRTAEEALAGIETIRSAYGRHAAAAREIAEECFDSDRVLPRLVREVGVAE